MISNEKVQGLWVCAIHFVAMYETNHGVWIILPRAPQRPFAFSLKTKKHRFITILLPFSFRRLHATVERGVNEEELKLKLLKRSIANLSPSCLCCCFIFRSRLKLSKITVRSGHENGQDQVLWLTDWLTDWLRSHQYRHLTELSSARLPDGFPSNYLNQNDNHRHFCLPGHEPTRARRSHPHTRR